MKSRSFSIHVNFDHDSLFKFKSNMNNFQTYGTMGHPNSTSLLRKAIKEFVLELPTMKKGKEKLYRFWVLLQLLWQFARLFALIYCISSITKVALMPFHKLPVFSVFAAYSKILPIHPSGSLTFKISGTIVLHQNAHYYIYFEKKVR